MTIIVGRPIADVALNGLEYLLDDKGEVIRFAGIKTAKLYLSNAGVPDDELDDFVYEDDKMTPKAKKTIALTCYADNFTLKDLCFASMLDHDNLGFFVVPVDWLVKRLEHLDEPISLEAFLSEYDADRTDGWVKDAAAQGVLVGFGYGNVDPNFEEDEA